jgi:polysaccharide export outer membrane protein
MTARTLRAPGRWVVCCLAPLLPALAGCHGHFDRYHENKIPQYGIIDPHQPRELQMTTLPPHVVAPRDELDIAVKPPVPDLTQSTFTVQPDGTIDLGFLGDVYVTGLTLAQAEIKLAQILMLNAGANPPRQPYKVSVRLASGSTSKSYYVIGTVTTQGRFPITGNETVLDAILTAGLRTNSLPEKSYLVRPHPAGGPDQVLRIDWFGIKDRGDTLTNYQVLPGDRIVVPGGKPPGLLSTLLGGK